MDSGSLFFDVSEPLEDDESMNIRTSTMVVGIRGTSGWVKIVDQWTSVLYMLEGAVTVMVTDPVTGETKSEPVKAGETVTCEVYPQDRDGTKCDIIRQTFTEDDVEGFTLVDLVQDRPLREKIKEDSGLEITDSADEAARKLKDDQEAVRKKLEEIARQLEEQEHDISQDPVWSNPGTSGTAPSGSSGESDSARGSSSGSGSSPSPEPVEPATYTVVFDAGDGTVSPASAATGEDGKLASLPTPTRTGYTFDGWFTEDGEAVTTETVFARDTTIHARWTANETPPPPTYTVTFDANGGTVSPTSAVTGEDGRLSNLPVPVRTVRGGTNVVFDGWYTEAGEKVDTSTVFGANRTVTAHWKPDWDFDASTGKLTIIGNGPMESIEGYKSNSDSGQPWNSQKSTITSVEISPGITSIGDRAFSDCRGLTSVTIPDSVTSIGHHAFSGCSELTSVTIPDNVTSIGICAFRGCRGLTSITIPDSVTSLGEGAFMYCDGLTSVTIGNNIASIKDSAFSGCSGLTSITIPNSVTSIYDEAFSGCSGLTSVTIPDSVTSIYDAFQSCNRLVSIDVDENNSAYASHDGVLYNKNKTVLLDCPEGKSGEYVIPDGVTRIGASAFFLCYNITSLTIPKTLTNINSFAFQNCGLSDIYYTGTEEEWNAIAIDDGNHHLTSATIHYESTTFSSVSYAAPPVYTDVPAGKYHTEAVAWAIAPFLDGWAASDTVNNAVRLVAGSGVRTLNRATSEKLKTARLGVVFDRPTGLAADDSGSLYVSDTGNGAVRKIKDGAVTTVAAEGLTTPRGLLLQGGSLYVCDSFARKIVVCQLG